MKNPIGQLILKILFVASKCAVGLVTFLLKNVGYCLLGCIKILFAPKHQAFTALVLIAACLIDVNFAYKYTYGYKYAECIHLIIISSPFAYLASIGRQTSDTKGVYGNGR